MKPSVGPPVRIPGVLSPDECAEIIRDVTPLLKPSKLGYPRAVGRSRTSYDRRIQLGDTNDLTLHRLRKAIAWVTGLPLENQEPFTALRYERGQEYRTHVDALLPTATGSSGQRAFSVVAYLHAPARGGATVFPALRLSFAPVAGSMLVWANAGGRARHASAPVEAGTKWALATWVRERAYSGD